MLRDLLRVHGRKSVVDVVGNNGLSFLRIEMSEVSVYHAVAFGMNPLQNCIGAWNP